MRDAKPYWTKHPAYVEHWLLASVDHESGKWEMFCVDYKSMQNYAGGKRVEFYWSGDNQWDLEWTPVTNPKEMLEQFIDHWLDEDAH